MKNTFTWRLVTICILTIICNVNVTHSQDILWEKSYGGKFAEYLSDEDYFIVPDDDSIEVSQSPRYF